LPDRTVGILDPIDRNCLFEGVLCVVAERFNIHHVARAGETKTLQLSILTAWNTHTAKKLSSGDELRVSRILKLVFPENNVYHSFVVVPHLDAIGVTIHVFSFRHARLRHILFHRGTPSVEGVLIRIPDSLRIVNSRIAREVSILRNHRARRRDSLDVGIFNSATCP
jgi:hypothetical protein